MNIVVIGSCTDSSNLARELNKRLHDSIVARIDLLKNIKQLVLQGMNMNTTENIGAYIGDVETFDLSKVSADVRKQIITAAEVIDSTVTKVADRADRTVLSTFDALTNGLPTGTYSLIKVYSGITDDVKIRRLSRDGGFWSNAIVVVIKKPTNTLLPIVVSSETIDKMKKDAFAFVECEELQDVFKSDVFQLLFELNNDKKKPVAEPEPVALVTENLGLIAEQALAEAVQEFAQAA